MSRDMPRAFLADVLANSDDDAPRLVFADWLDENGDEERAEFIRVQIARARLPEWDTAQVRLRLREAELIRQHGEKWRAGLPAHKGVTWGGFRRGFVAEASFAGFAALRSCADACWAAAPVEAVSISWPRPGDKAEVLQPIDGLRHLSLAKNTALKGDVARLAVSPLLSTLRWLDVSDCELGAEGFQQLVSSPHLRELKALHASYNSVGNAGIDAICAARLDALEDLDLSEDAASGEDGGYGYGQYGEDPVIDAAGVAVLVDWPGLARLRSLKLSGSNVRREGLGALLRAPGAAGLKLLVLRSAGLAGDVGREFADADPALRLDVLDLGGNFLAGDVYGYLGRAESLGELKALKLDRCELRGDDTRRLTEAAFLESLRLLDVSHDILETEGLCDLLDRSPPALHTLLLRDTDVGDEGVAYLAESPASDVLLEVDLSGNRLGDRAAAALASAKHLRSLLVLRLGGNTIGKSTAEALARSELGQRLAVLKLDDA